MHRHCKEALMHFVKNVYSQMMLLLFVFYELVVLQVLWMKGCTVML
jgi:hypothetical protein